MRLIIVQSQASRAPYGWVKKEFIFKIEEPTWNLGRAGAASAVRHTRPAARPKLRVPGASGTEIKLPVRVPEHGTPEVLKADAERMCDQQSLQVRVVMVSD